MKWIKTKILCQRIGKPIIPIELPSSSLPLNALFVLSSFLCPFLSPLVRNNDLLMADLSDEKHHLNRQLEEVKEALRSSEEEKIYFQSKVNELALKLAESHNLREEGVYRAAR